MHEIEGLEILSTAQMYAADAAAIGAGRSGDALMEAAGFHVAVEIRKRWSRRRVLVLCGPGNNGGDGFVVARLLKKAGWPVRLGLLGESDKLKGEAALNLKRWQAVGGPVEDLAPDHVPWADLVVDGLFGAGLARPLDGAARETIAAVIERGAPCVAIDVPSGVSGDTAEIVGDAEGLAPPCHLTVTFFRPKPAHVLLPGRDLCGEVQVVDIGIPDSVLDQIKPSARVNGPEIWDLRSATPFDHKYSRGHAVVFGSAEMSGAARLAAAAARRTGAGLVTVAGPGDARAEYVCDAPGLMFQAITEGTFTEALADPRRTAVVMGPGYGTGDRTQAQVLEVLRASKSGARGVVLDADALTSFADQAETLWAACRDAGSVVLTPHEGEFFRLFNGIDHTLDKINRVQLAAQMSGATVVLKGSDTVIAAPDGRVAVNVNAPPWLATAGSGDVLAGAIGGLLAAGMPAWAAACAGVWLHGAAAQKAGVGLVAEDLVTALPIVLGSALPGTLEQIEGRL